MTREQRDAMSKEFLALSSLETVTKQRRLAMLRVLDAARAGGFEAVSVAARGGDAP